MSCGVVVCSVCARVVHQTGPSSTWEHCIGRHGFAFESSGDELCEGATVVSPKDARGVCQRDACPEYVR